MMIFLVSIYKRWTDGRTNSKRSYISTSCSSLVIPLISKYIRVRVCILRVNVVTLWSVFVCLLFFLRMTPPLSLSLLVAQWWYSIDVLQCVEPPQPLHTAVIKYHHHHYYHYCIFLERSCIVVVLFEVSFFDLWRVFWWVSLLICVCMCGNAYFLPLLHKFQQELQWPQFFSLLQLSYRPCCEE